MAPLNDKWQESSGISSGERNKNEKDLLKERNAESYEEELSWKKDVQWREEWKVTRMPISGEAQRRTRPETGQTKVTRLLSKLFESELFISSLALTLLCVCVCRHAVFTSSLLIIA